MKILALDTSTEACSAALLIDTEIHQRYEVAPREHGALILPMIETLLSEAGCAPTQLDALAFGRGPGAFVGVRIATGVAQGIAFAADLPVIPVSSLAAMAQSVEHGNVYSAIDARMNEVYWGAYRKYARLFDVPVQYCMAHLIREIRFLAEHSVKKLSRWGNLLLKWLKKLFKTLHSRSRYTSEGFIRAMEQIKQGFLSRM